MLELTIESVSFVQAINLSPFVITELGNNIESIKTTNNISWIRCCCCWVMRDSTEIFFDSIEIIWSILLWSEWVIGPIGPLQWIHVHQFRFQSTFSSDAARRQCFTLDRISQLINYSLSIETRNPGLDNNQVQAYTHVHIYLFQHFHNFLRRNWNWNLFDQLLS